jgi:hypothetical protein
MNLKQLQTMLTTKQQYQSPTNKVHVEGGPLQDARVEGTKKQVLLVVEGSDSVATASTCSSSLCRSASTTEESLPQHQQQRRRRRRRQRVVHFNTEVSQRNILPCVNDYSREEIEQCWFLPEESFQMTQRCIKEILMIEKGTKLKGKK